MVTGFLSLDAYGFLRERNLERSYSVFMLDTSVVRGFALCRFPGGDDADCIPLLIFKVTNQEQLRVRTQTKQQEALFLARVILVEELHGKLIKEHGARVLERDAVLLQVRVGLRLVPVEPHTYIVFLVLSESGKRVRKAG